jgi:thiol-disulfide isomerase/thioredoxin
MLITILCLAALHALPEDAPTPEELLRALQKEVGEKLWKQPDEWRENHPGQKTLVAWQNARTEQWGMHFLVRYTEFFERYPKTEFLWSGKQDAHLIWGQLQELKKPEYQKYLDDWKVKWPGDNVIERRFYTSRLRELAKQFPDIEDAEKIARALTAEFPVRREPHRALLSLARRKGAEAYETTLREILKNAGTPETVKAYLQGKTGDAKREDEPYDYRGKKESGDREIDHYEIRYAQLSSRSPRSVNWWEEEEKTARALIAEFPEQTRSYRQLFFLAGKRGEDLGAARAWLLEFVKGPAPDAVKADMQEHYFESTLQRECLKNFIQALYTRNLPAPGESKAWLEKYAPLWRTYLEAYADFVEGRLKRSEIEEAKIKGARRDTIRLLTELSRITADPEYRRHLETLNTKWLTLPGWSEEDRLFLRGIQLYAQEADVSGQMADKFKLYDHPINVYPPEVFERVTRTLMKEFPQQAGPYEDVLLLAGRKGPLERPLLQEILDSQAPASVKETVQNVIDQMNRVGQPLKLKGAAADGREIDVQRMKGNVVLIDFWATWCGPCLGEVPRMKSLYGKFHERGFEIIGVSLDEKQETLKAFLEKNPTPWPQHWIKSWSRFGINSIPTLWLVDKKGIVRDVNAREGLEQKVERLLAEP